MALPESLVGAIRANRWKPPDDEVLRSLFGDDPVQARFYDLEYLPFENAPWPSETEPFYLGEIDAAVEPGDIDPRRSVLIGDLGPDMPIALDYRPSTDQPIVVYLSTKDARWHRIANSVEELMERLEGARER
jgi:hypothetical protein